MTAAQVLPILLSHELRKLIKGEKCAVLLLVTSIAMLTSVGLWSYKYHELRDRYEGALDRERDFRTALRKGLETTDPEQRSHIILSEVQATSGVLPTPMVFFATGYWSDIDPEVRGEPDMFGTIARRIHRGVLERRVAHLDVAYMNLSQN